MSWTTDPTTCEISNSRLKLVDELVFAPQAYGQTTYYHIEHPSRGKFYRVGYPEYVFLSLLDGTRTVAQALTITARTLGSKALAHSRGLQVANWLMEQRLAHFAEAESAWSLASSGAGRTGGDVWKRVNPFWMKLCLGSPDRLLSSLLPALGWLFSPWATVASFTLILFGFGGVLSHWTQFVASAATVLAPHNWVWVFLAWVFLKIIHELSHGLACKYYGGEVRETGLVFILLAPMAYVDVTSCWRFPSRWQRIHVAAAGIGAELVTAALAVILWIHVESPVAQNLLFNIILMASLSTLLFNANPLMRFDGYYILADLVEIPNLGSEGNRFFKSLARRCFFGEKRRPMELLGFRRWIVYGYGLAAPLWRLLVCVSLVTAASVLFHGAGIGLAVIGIGSWFGVPMWKCGVDLHRRMLEHRPSFLRCVMTSTVIVVSLLATLLWVPCPGARQVPVVVEYANRSIVRTNSPGFVRKVHVFDGQAVAKGHLLVELDNDELAVEKKELESSYQQEVVRQRVALNQRDGSEAQIAEQNLNSIRERLGEVTDQLESLQIKATTDGIVVARNLEQSIGTYVKEGEVILTVADETEKELVVSVAQEEIDAVIPRVGKPIRFRIGGRLARNGRLDRLDPRASTDLPHPAMSSQVGGQLAVVAHGAEGQEAMRLAEPRFRGMIELPPDVCQDLGAGEQGHAILGIRSESIGEFAWVRIHRWWETLLRPAKT